MSNPLVSVVIPAYNAEQFIGEALDSVFAQTYRPIEIIVVDDGSIDKTTEIVENYVQVVRIVQDERSAPTIRTSPASEAIVFNYIRQLNSGPSKARNAGIKAANGEYIAFLDADDLWTADKLERQMELFKKDAGIDIVFTDVRITRLRQGKIAQTIMFQNKELNAEFFGHDYIVINPLEKLLKLNFIPTSSVVGKRVCFDGDFLFNQNRRYVEDWELWLAMSLCYRFGYVNKPCVHKQEKGDGLSSNSVHMLLSKLDVFESFLRRNMEYVSSQIPRKSLSACIKDTYTWAGYYFMLNGNDNLARHYYKKSLKESLNLRGFFYYLRTFL